MIKILVEHLKGRKEQYLIVIGLLISISNYSYSIKPFCYNLVNGDPEHGKSTI